MVSGVYRSTSGVEARPQLSLSDGSNDGLPPMHPRKIKTAESCTVGSHDHHGREMIDFDDFDLSDEDDVDADCSSSGTATDDMGLRFGDARTTRSSSTTSGGGTRRRSDVFVSPKLPLVTLPIPPPTERVCSNNPVLPSVIALLREKAPDVAQSAIEVLMSTFMHSSATQGNSSSVPQSPHRLSLISSSPSFSDMTLQRGSTFGGSAIQCTPNGPLEGVFDVWMPGSGNQRVPRLLVLYRNCLMEYNPPAAASTIADTGSPVGCTVLHSQMLLRPAEPMISHKCESSNFDENDLEFEMLCPQDRILMCRELAHLWGISKASGIRMLRNGTDLTLDHERTAENLLGVLPLQAFSRIAAYLHGVHLLKVARSLLSLGNEQQVNTWTESLHQASLFHIGDFCKLRPGR
jgi:hypothetical protein